jgi:hypothetical protein
MNTTHLIQVYNDVKYILVTLEESQFNLKMEKSKHMTNEQTDGQELNHLERLEIFYQGLKEIDHLARGRFDDMHELLAYAVRIGPNVNQLILSTAIENRNVAKFDYEVAHLNHEIARLSSEIGKGIYYATDEHKRNFYLAIEDLKKQIQKIRKMHPERQTSILSDSQKRELLAGFLNDDIKNQENIPHDDEDNLPNLEDRKNSKQTYLKQLAWLTYRALDLEHIARNTYYEINQLASYKEKTSHMNNFELYRHYNELACLLHFKRNSLSMDSFHEEVKRQVSFSTEVSNEDSSLSIDSQIENYYYNSNIANFHYSRTSVRHQIALTNFEMAQKNGRVAALHYKAIKQTEHNVKKFLDGISKAVLDDIEWWVKEIKARVRLSGIQ